MNEIIFGVLDIEKFNDGVPVEECYTRYEYSNFHCFIVDFFKDLTDDETLDLLIDCWGETWYDILRRYFEIYDREVLFRVEV